MSLQGTLAVAWLFGTLGLVAAFGYFLVWFDDRARRRKHHNGAG